MVNDLFSNINVTDYAFFKVAALIVTRIAALRSALASLAVVSHTSYMSATLCNRISPGQHAIYSRRLRA